MAKSIRSQRGKKLRALRRVAMKDVFLERDIRRNTRLRAYHTEQEVNKLVQENRIEAENITDQAKAAMTYAKQLHQVDEQKRLLREKGNFFFVHPHAKADIFPVVEEPADLGTHTGENIIGDIKPVDQPEIDMDSDIKVKKPIKKALKKRKSVWNTGIIRANKF